VHVHLLLVECAEVSSGTSVDHHLLVNNSMLLFINNEIQIKKHAHILHEKPKKKEKRCSLGNNQAQISGEINNPKIPNVPIEHKSNFLLVKYGHKHMLH
jgi:hypothetical protein